MKIRGKYSGNYSHLGLKHTSHTLCYSINTYLSEKEKKRKLVKTNFPCYVNNLGLALNLESHTREGSNFQLTCVVFSWVGKGPWKEGEEGKMRGRRMKEER